MKAGVGPGFFRPEIGGGPLAAVVRVLKSPTPGQVQLATAGFRIEIRGGTSGCLCIAQRALAPPCRARGSRAAETQERLVRRPPDYGAPSGVLGGDGASAVALIKRRRKPWRSRDPRALQGRRVLRPTRSGDEIAQVLELDRQVDVVHYDVWRNLENERREIEYRVHTSFDQLVCHCLSRHPRHS